MDVTIQQAQAVLQKMIEAAASGVATAVAADAYQALKAWLRGKRGSGETLVSALEGLEHAPEDAQAQTRLGDALSAEPSLCREPEFIQAMQAMQQYSNSGFCIQNQQQANNNAGNIQQNQQQANKIVNNIGNIGTLNL